MRWSVRTIWTVMFGGMFLLAGAILLLINYVLVNEIVPQGSSFASRMVESPGQFDGEPPPKQTGGGVRVEQITVAGAVNNFRSSAMQTLLVASGIALIAAGALAALLGWVMAGRALRPVHMITATARRLGAANLDRRINLDGPQDELKELADTFDGMLDRLATSFDAQRRFVANASHELRTPLAVQRTLIEVAMADPTAGPELLRLGQHLLHTNQRSERLIEGLLLLARSDQGLVHRLPVRLDEIVDGVLRSTAPLADEQGVTLVSELGSCPVVGDQVLLERLVTNLVHNAVHYNEPGGTVQVTVATTPALVISNTGPVVPPDAVPELFEPFRRLNRTRLSGAVAAGDSSVRVRDGAGLGLSIVRSIARAHDGTVHAEPNRAGGLRIAVYLPAVDRAGSAHYSPSPSLRLSPR